MRVTEVYENEASGVTEQDAVFVRSNELLAGTPTEHFVLTNDISKMPRILFIRDYSIGSMQNSVTAGFTLVAYHAPPPAEMPALPADLAQIVENSKTEVAKQ